MISGNKEHADSLRSEPCQYFVEEFDRLRRWNGAVIHITGNDESIGTHILAQCKQFLQYIRLILCHMPLSEEFSQMPICRMNETHDIPSSYLMFILLQPEFLRQTNCRCPDDAHPYPKISLL